jgi:molybdate transport system substrate-binding protein
MDAYAMHRMKEPMYDLCMSKGRVWRRQTVATRRPVPRAPTRARRLCLALLVAVAPVLTAPAAAQAVTVYAAASLSTVLPRIDGSPRYNFAGSNQLQLQIERGAPADVFASAGPQEAQALFRADRCTRPVTFATNVLVIITPRNNRAGIRSAYDLRHGRSRLAIGTPGVPIGSYTRRLLRRMRLSSVLTSNTVSLEPDVKSIIAKVALGSADAGFAYRSDYRAARGRLNLVRLPRWAQPPVRYLVCAVRRPGVDSAGATRFIRRVWSTSGRKVLRRAGFGLPPRG